MRVQLVDPSGYSTPYDYALGAALARAGASVELVTSRFVHGPTPSADGMDVIEHFYGRATREGRSPQARRALKLAEHVPGMVGYRRRAEDADVRHYQWLPLEPVDTLLLPPQRPRVMTMHNVRRRGDGRAAARVTRRLAHQMDALIVHTRDAEELLVGRFGADPARVHVIPHGAFDYLTRLPEEHELPPNLRGVEGPVVLWFGNLRDYKGVDVLLDAFRDVEGAELWIVGRPAMPIEPLRAAAQRARGTVRFVSRFITDPEIPAYFRRADLVVLPYRRIDQSGVLYTALAFGKPLVLSSVGGFREIAEDHGAGRLVTPGDPDELATALRELLADPAARERLADASARAASEDYSWDSIAARTMAVYREVMGERAA